MSKAKSALPQGSLDLVILRTLAHGPRHGYAIAKHLHEVSAAFIEVEEGSLYPALHRLERRGWIESSWGASEANRKAKYYKLTPQGKKQLQVETKAWLDAARAIELVLTHRPTSA